MEMLKQRRTPLRSSFTRTLNQLKEQLAEADVDPVEMETLMAQLEVKGQKLQKLDSEILKLMQDNECSQEEYDNEFESSEHYEDKLISSRIQTKRKLEKPSEEVSRNEMKNENESRNSDNRHHRSYKLPEIELKKFGGEFRDWLGFWGQFKKIDEDSSIDPQDKYQYLLQSTTLKSKAREIVESFPPTAENYPKAVEHLKQRFGREETLVEVYVRDLLTLVLNNTSDKRPCELPKLYDKLETKLRALESLGVTQEKYAAMLYPLVESCLPTDILRAWERNRGFICAPEERGKSDLSSLMKFLRIEVEGEQRITLARTSFKVEQEFNKNNYKKDNYDKELSRPFATATELFNSNSANKPQRFQKKFENLCIFCENKHSNHECWKAKKMSLEQKRQIISRNGCCFLCLRKGHVARMCKGNQKCANCEKRHFSLMCPDVSQTAPKSNLVKPSEDKINETAQDNVLTNQSCTSSIKMQTLKVYLRGKNGRRVFRALIDTGSQKSYIKTQVAKQMGYEAIGEETVVHSLFGGIESSQQKHSRFRIFLTSLDGNYHCNFEALDQEKICGNISGVENGPWIQELREHGITLTDTVCHEANKDDDSEIQVLIGADVAGKLLNRKIHTLKSGLVAVGTHLGWTLMGKIEGKFRIPESSLSVVSLFVKDSSIADLPSRGCSVYQHQLKQSRWWERPDWLKRPKKYWPTEDTHQNEERRELPRERKRVELSRNCEVILPPQVTRSGRTVKPPDRLIENFSHRRFGFT